MAQEYERVVQEDLNVGTAGVWIKAANGGELYSTQIGLHSFARGQKQYTATWAPGSIAAGSKASTTVTVPDAAVADFVLASHDKMLTSDLRISGHVSAADTVKVVIHNPTSAAVTVASGTVAVLVFPVISVPVIAYQLLTFTWAQVGGESCQAVSFATTISEDYPGMWDTGGVLTWSWGDGSADTVVNIDSDDLGAQFWDHSFVGDSFPGGSSYSVTLTIVGNSNGFAGQATATVTTDCDDGMSGSSGE